MKQLTKYTAAALAGMMLFLAGSANAQDNAPWYEGMDILGFASATYGYNFNNPASQMNDLRVFDQRSNTFLIDVAQLSLQKIPVNRGEAGMRMDVIAGSSVPQSVASSGLLSGQDIDLLQGYVMYIAPIGNGLQIDMGKFTTHIGYELIEGVDGYNDNVTRSLCFGFAIPFAHTGIRFWYPFSDDVSAMLMVANGWDNAVDNNTDKSVGAQLALTPTDEFAFYLNGIYGAEGDGDNGNKQSVIDVVATYQITDMFSVGANVDYGMLGNAVADDAEEDGLADATWLGVAGYVRADLNDWFSLAFRGEMFDDADGERTGTVQQLMTFTLTPEFRVADGCVIRADIRMDTSDEMVFHQEFDPANDPEEDRYTDSQNTVTLNMLFLLD